MRTVHWPTGLLIAGTIAVLVGLAIAYRTTSDRLFQAIAARRDDDYAQAEGHLDSCRWLPGLRAAIARETDLLAVQQGDISEESSWQNRAAAAAPTERLLILEALAKGHLATFQWAAAEDYAEQILQRQPTSARALWLRGKARVAMQQEERALLDLRRALELEPEGFEIRRSLADLLHVLGHVQECARQYEVLISQRPHDMRVILALARCCQEQAQQSVAERLLDGLLASQPRNVAALVERGRLALRGGDAAAAELWLRKAAELRPDHAQANSVLRLALRSQHKTDPALEQRIEMGQRQQADLKTRLRDSQDPALLKEVGRWMVRTGQDDDAPGWFYAALQQDPNHVAAHLGLADVYSQRGQLRRAGYHARRAGRQQPAISPDQHFEPARQNASPSGQLVLPDLPIVEASTADVHRICAACHAFPSPESMPQAAWRKEVKQGYDFLHDSALAGDFPALENVVRYYERRAPVRLPAFETPSAQSPPPVTFEKRSVGVLPRLPPHPGITNLNLARLFGEEQLELLLCDAKLDAVLVLRPYQSAPGGNVLQGVSSPCHTSVCDLDGDGHQDLLVSSLGSFFPTDDLVGQVLWLQGAPEGRFEVKPIWKGVGRVADVQAADFSGDGRLDLLVAAFGWRNAGEILYLENQTTDWASPQFVSHVLDSRHGAIHVPAVDLNSDHRPDFVALLSQDHETVVAYLNQGSGEFRQEVIFAAPHPSYGSSGIEMVDLDGDGDADVVLTNGDILDRPYLLKPYHGVQWLENEGKFPFKHHPLAAMPGASRAVAADFDSDGDQDIAAVSFLPGSLFPEREKLQLPAVVLLEQRTPADFALHVLEIGTCDHLSCAAGDWDGDGRIDLAVANFSWDSSQPLAGMAMLWRNSGKASPMSRALVPRQSTDRATLGASDLPFSP